MATVIARAHDVVPPRSVTPPPHLSLNTSSRGTPAAVPNKHIPICSPGPRPVGRPDTPPASPPSANSIIETSSLLYPPTEYPILSHDPPTYAITASGLAAALDHIATQPLPDPRQVFPWLHGLHADNQIQLAFFTARRKSLRRAPRCIRGITLVKAGGDLSAAKLKGAIAPQELLHCVGRPGSSSSPTNSEILEEEEDEELLANFLDIDPRDGFGVRNFQIQACKMATVSDIVVYGDAGTSREEVQALGRRVASAQRAWRERSETVSGAGEHVFSTFVVTDPFTKFEDEHQDIVAIDSEGNTTGKVMDFFHQERAEMCVMSKATEICPNVFLGPTPDPTFDSSDVDLNYDLLIEASELAQLPDGNTLKTLETLLREPDHGAIHLEFPSSGSIMPPTWSHAEVDSLLETCQWIYNLVNSAATPSSSAPVSPTTVTAPLDDLKDVDGDSIMLSDLPSSTTHPAQERSHNAAPKILIHCSDGYTESSLLALAYYMYSRAVPAHQAWLELHRDGGRNFFAYPSDVALLTVIQPRILHESPASSSPPLALGRVDSVVEGSKHGNGNGNNGGTSSVEAALARLAEEPEWLGNMDGSLPSRILPYMYLGNLNHANNPQLLRALGIRRVLSVGEPVSWRGEVEGLADGETAQDGWRKEDLLFIDRVQDNGVDPLTEEFERCLEFIEQGKKDGTATLVHCRVGVSRSATICIAEVMNETGLSFPRAYCFVRARRLNVIIQPHLRFSYELLKWEEYQHQRRGEPIKRELEWATIAREIALMNKPYSRPPPQQQ
ncbi:MAG: tyrosine/serine/threonine protein phosphatase pps1 [Bathelium mastoideum]|nr:MAG: tyrosine/serine/threonine protein phosphatase pps1 [Bathelium mastoideum]